MMLTATHELILSTLAKSDLRDRFYWTGGTLLSHYYLHHRKSFDLDFFTEKPFEHDELLPFIHAVKKALDIDHFEETKIYDRWEYMIPTTDPVTRFEFVYYNHEKKRLKPLLSYRGLFIDNITDMAANKVMAYLDRNQPKDLLDVYTLLREKKFTLTELLQCVEQKYGERIPEFLFWSESGKSLKRLEDLRPYLLESDPNKQNEFLQDMKHFFLDQGKDFLTTLLE